MHTTQTTTTTTTSVKFYLRQLVVGSFTFALYERTFYAKSISLHAQFTSFNKSWSTDEHTHIHKFHETISFRKTQYGNLLGSENIVVVHSAVHQNTFSRPSPLRLPFRGRSVLVASRFTPKPSPTALCRWCSNKRCPVMARHERFFCSARSPITMQSYDPICPDE